MLTEADTLQEAHANAQDAFYAVLELYAEQNRPLPSSIQHDQLGDFDAGELDRLLIEGERSIELLGTLGGEEAFQKRGKRRREDVFRSPRAR